MRRGFTSLSNMLGDVRRHINAELLDEDTIIARRVQDEMLRKRTPPTWNPDQWRSASGSFMITDEMATWAELDVGGEKFYPNAEGVFVIKPRKIGTTRYTIHVNQEAPHAPDSCHRERRRHRKDRGAGSSFTPREPEGWRYARPTNTHYAAPQRT